MNAPRVGDLSGRNISLVGMVSLRKFLGLSQQIGQGVGNRSWLFRDPCPYCGDKSTTQEHIIPVSKGGLGMHNNTVGACLKCNSSRGNTPFLIWWGLKHRMLTKVDDAQTQA